MAWELRDKLTELMQNALMISWSLWIIRTGSCKRSPPPPPPDTAVMVSVSSSKFTEKRKITTTIQKWERDWVYPDQPHRNKLKRNRRLRFQNCEVLRVFYRRLDEWKYLGPSLGAPRSTKADESVLHLLPWFCMGTNINNMKLLNITQRKLTKMGCYWDPEYFGT